MSIEVVPITSEQLNLILQKEESHFLDFKAREVKPAKLCKFISGFANADGGELYIGIDEETLGNTKTRHWRGFADQESANGHLQIFEELFPLGDGYSYTFLSSECHPGLVLQVTILKSRGVVEASDGTPYLRRSAQTVPITTPEALERLKLDKGIESFERKTIDVELKLITASEVMSEFINAVVPTTEAELWLKKQQLIHREKPRIAGILLFADQPQPVFPKHCGVKIYRYKTKESEGTRDTLDFDPITIEGCLYKQVQEAVTTTREIIEKIPKMGNQGLENIQYPEETIHEIVTNALLHRDYSIASDTHIRIFDNRIEIENPGKLPGHVTVKNILREQYARNGAIVRIINKFPNPPNKDVGEGLNTAFQAMAKLKLQPPDIKETENSVIVYIKHEPLASIEAQIMSYLEKHKEITNEIARNETGIQSELRIKNAFTKLRDSGLIEAVPRRSKRNAAWRRVGTIDEDSENAISIYEMYPEYERLVMDYLEEHEEITNSIGRELLGIDKGQAMKNIFYRMKKNDLIELVPGKPRITAAWRKVKSRPT